MSYSMYVFQFTVGLTVRIIILLFILKYFAKEIIKNCKKAKRKPIKSNNDIKKRLEKANRTYYKTQK